MVMEVVHEDIGEDGNMHCTNHPYKNSSPGGICALCLQEKLGKLVSSSFPSPVFPSSPSYESQKPPIVTKNKDKILMGGSDSTSNIAFKRSKSTTSTARKGTQFLDDDYGTNSSHHTRGSFWSFLYFSNPKKGKDLSFTPATPTSSIMGSNKKRDEFVTVDENSSSPDEDHECSFDRKVSRSRSVGCGSRSFSGDLFDKISNGLGDCTLRRVESHREGKGKIINGQDCIKERVSCGGIFSGFMVTPSSSYLVDNHNGNGDGNGKSISGSHGVGKSWGWALASPIRAFSKQKKRAKNSTPNLAAIPSLLAV